MLFKDYFFESTASNFFLQNKINSNNLSFANYFFGEKHNSSIEERKQFDTDFISQVSIQSIDQKIENPQSFKQPMFLTNKRMRQKYSKPKKPISIPQSKYKCEHCNCSNYFNTSKQKASHHHKMNHDCINDSIAIMKLISKTKRLVYHTWYYTNKDKRNLSFLNNIKAKYEDTIRYIINEDFFQHIAGKRFDDYLTDDDDDEKEEEEEMSEVK